MLVRKSGGRWEEPPVKAYDNEAALQALIAESPQLVTDIDLHPAVAIRELEIPSMGYLDVLVVRADGQLTLVEAKLARNPEIRRSVVGQLLGYAGGLWRLSYDALDDAVRARQSKALDELVAERAADDVEFIEADFRRAVASNLDEGAFRLIFAVDEITAELRRVVEYLNSQTTTATEVVALELGYAKVDDVEILDPRRYGSEAAGVRSARARTTNRWTEADLFAALERETTPEAVAAARRLHEWAKPRVHHFYWGEGQGPSMTGAFEVPEGMIQPWSIYTGGWGTALAINFEFARRRPRTALHAFLDDLQTIPKIASMRDEIVDRDFAKRPSVPLVDASGHGDLPVGGQVSPC